MDARGVGFGNEEVALDTFAVPSRVGGFMPLDLEMEAERSWKAAIAEGTVLLGPPIGAEGIVAALELVDFDWGPSEMGTRRGPDPLVGCDGIGGRGGTKHLIFVPCPTGCIRTSFS